MITYSFIDPHQLGWRMASTAMRLAILAAGIPIQQSRIGNVPLRDLCVS